MVPLRVWSALAFAALVAVAPRARAVDTASRSGARDLGYEGVEAYQAGDYAAAMDRLERAYSVLKVPSLGLWSARALEKNGKLVEASERYLEATRLRAEAEWDKDVQKEAQEQAAQERAALVRRIPKLTVAISGTDPAGVEVTVNGTSVARALYEVGHPVNPGEVVVVGVDGARRVEAKITVQEGTRPSVTLDFGGPIAVAEAGAAPAPTSTAPAEGAAQGGSWQRTAGWIGIGVGAAGIVFGSVTGILAIGKNSELSTACPSGNCPLDQQGALADYDALRTMSSAGFIVGAVLAATGVTLIVTAPKPETARFVAPYLGATSIGLRGAF